jgi:hypothetical protein
VTGVVLADREGHLRVVRSTISTFFTLPTFTPAMRMSSPFTTPVASLKIALYSWSSRVDVADEHHQHAGRQAR